MLYKSGYWGCRVNKFRPSCMTVKYIEGKKTVLTEADFKLALNMINA